jgi:hypothetical protein
MFNFEVFALRTAGKSKFRESDVDFRHLNSLILFSTCCGRVETRSTTSNREEGGLRHELRLLTEAAKWCYLRPRGARGLVLLLASRWLVQNFTTGEANSGCKHVRCRACHVFLPGWTAKMHATNLKRLTRSKPWGIIHLIMCRQRI